MAQCLISNSIIYFSIQPNNKLANIYIYIYDYKYIYICMIINVFILFYLNGMIRLNESSRYKLFSIQCRLN